MNMIEHFFGDAAAVQRKLVTAVRERCDQMELSCEDLDRLCRLGHSALHPKAAEFMGDPTRLTSEAFSLVASALRLDLSEVLELDLSDRQAMQAAIADMKESEVDVVAAVGGDVADIADAEKARVYILFKIMHELPRPAATAGPTT